LDIAGFVEYTTEMLKVTEADIEYLPRNVRNF